jgi:hypothetical protein
MSTVRSRNWAGVLLAVLITALAFPVLGEDSGSTGPETGKTAESAQPPAEEQKPAATGVASTPAPAIQTPPESPTPPKNLKKVGDHWTPYDPPDPESFPAGSRVHIIVKGDTLWDLAGSEFQNPYLWPQIWDVNRYILDSHWIYPGDPILLPAQPTVVTQIVPTEGQTGAPPLSAPEPIAPAESPEATPDEGLEEGLDGEEMAQLTPAEPAPEPAAAHAPAPAADFTDFHCTGEIRRDYRKSEVYIAQAEEPKVGLSVGDLVYLNAGREGSRVSPGDTFSVVAKGGEVFHPITDKWLGTYVRRLGLLKVLAAQDTTAIAEITYSCTDRIEVGFELEPERPVSVPEYRQVTLDRLDVEPSGKVNGYVVHLQDSMVRASTGKIVDLDLGSRDGIKPGDLLQVYVSSQPPAGKQVKYRFRWDNNRYESQYLRDDASHLRFPRKPIAILMVLSASERTATAKVMESRAEVEVGDRVELR